VGVGFNLNAPTLLVVVEYFYHRGDVFRLAGEADLVRDLVGPLVAQAGYYALFVCHNCSPG
jgi:hypothetical protein